MVALAKDLKPPRRQVLGTPLQVSCDSVNLREPGRFRALRYPQVEPWIRFSMWAVPRDRSPDRARPGAVVIGRAHEDAHALDDALAFDDDGDDGQAHELQEALRKEGSLPRNGRREPASSSREAIMSLRPLIV